MQDLRAKIFPLKRKRDKDLEITLPARRKERSISSLVVNTPRLSAQTGTTGKRTAKSLMRKDARGSSGSFTKRGVKKEEDHHTESGSSPETFKKSTQKKRQVKKILITYSLSLLFWYTMESSFCIYLFFLFFWAVVICRG